MDPVKSWLDAKEVRQMAESLMAPQPEVDPSVADAGYGESFEGFANAPAQGQEQGASAQSVPGQRASIENSLAMAQQVAQESGMLNPASGAAAQASTEPLPVQEPPVSPSSPSSAPPPQVANTEAPISPAEQRVSTHAQENIQQDEPVPQTTQGPSFGRGVAAVVDSNGSRGPFLKRLHGFSAMIRQEFGARAMFLIDNDGQVILDEMQNPKLIQVARTLANASYTAHRQSAGSAAMGNLHVKIGANAILEVVPVHSRYGLLVLGVIFSAPLGAERVVQLTSLLEKVVEPES